MAENKLIRLVINAAIGAAIVWASVIINSFIGTDTNTIKRKAVQTIDEQIMKNKIISPPLPFKKI